MTPITRASVCPHDCPSTCALEVEVAIDGAAASARCAGRRRTATRAGVICAKVARYAERAHHPDRLTAAAAAHRPEGLRPVPRRSAGTRRWTASPARSRDAAARHGVGGGLAVLLRRHDGAGAARRHQPAAPRDALLAPANDDLHRWPPRPAGRPASARFTGPDPREMAESRPDRDVGRQPGDHPGQRDDPHRPRPEGARREAGGDRPLPHRHRRGRPTCIWRCGPARDGALACAVMHVRLPRRLCRPRLHGANTPTIPAGLEAHLAHAAAPDWAAAITGLPVGRDRGLRPALQRHRAQLHPRRLRLLRACATARRSCTR